MAQPIFITPAGSLGTIPEGKFFQVPILAYDPDVPGPDQTHIYYEMIAGSLPEGVQCRRTGLIEGTPKAVASLQGVPTPVSQNVTSKFTVRAYTEKIVNGVDVIDRLRDQTFTLTVTGQDIPQFVTPAGNIGTYYDGEEVEIQLQFTDDDPGDTVSVEIVSGQLPPGLILSTSGLISGSIEPLTGIPGTASPGYDETTFDIYPFDFSTRSASRNYQFVVGITDGKDYNLRTFEIYVYSKDSMSGDTTDFTADNNSITADIVVNRNPVLLTPEGSIGTYRFSNYFAYKFTGIDFDGESIVYELITGLGADSSWLVAPPGLQLDVNTGWLYGFVPDLGAIESTYTFGIKVKQAGDFTAQSREYYFSINFTGDIENAVTWLTDSDLGVIDNGSISQLVIKATNPDNRKLQFRIKSDGSYNKLPQGLTLMSDGSISGQVSFNGFALDGGTTTFNRLLTTRLTTEETTFDRKFTFTVEAYNDDVANITYRVIGITVINGGSGYSSTPTVTISAPPATGESIQAVAGKVNVIGNVITGIDISEPGDGYLFAPTITITDSTGSNASAIAVIEQTGKVGNISVSKTFTVLINRKYNEPYVGLYIKAMPTSRDREVIKQLIDNQDIITPSLIYRPQDPNFGKASVVKYAHAYGISTATLEAYFNSLDINHYRKKLVLGEIKTARALDLNGDVLYEVVYSEVKDDLINNRNQSVSKSVTLKYPINEGDSTEIDTVYPNSLVNMRDQVIESVGQISAGLPLWMTSKQADGSVLGFVSAWVICYTVPNGSARIKYNIENNFAQSLNTIDFIVDRVELEGKMTRFWTVFEDSTLSGNWESAVATTFDSVETIFDGDSCRFITPNDSYIDDDRFDKYLVFSRTNILG